MSRSSIAVPARRKPRGKTTGAPVHPQQAGLNATARELRRHDLPVGNVARKDAGIARELVHAGDEASAIAAS